MGRVRCFFCLPLAPELKKEIAAWIAANRAAISGVRWVAEADLHVTLRFCGEIPQAAAQPLGDRAKNLLAERCAAPLRLTLRETGTFGRPPRVLWAGLGGDTAALERLNALIEGACRDAGLPPDGPYGRLARVRPGGAGRSASMEACRARLDGRSHDLHAQPPDARGAALRTVDRLSLGNGGGRSVDFDKITETGGISLG